MISLQQHILEKLKINKYYKKAPSQPNSRGRCLQLYIGSPQNDTNQRICLYNNRYSYDSSTKTVKVDNPNDEYIENEYGYFIEPQKRWDTIYWIVVLLFNEEAIEFLESLSIDNKQLIDISKYINVKKYSNTLFPCMNDFDKYYDPKTIEIMIKAIKRNI